MELVIEYSRSLSVRLSVMLKRHVCNAAWQDQCNIVTAVCTLQNDLYLSLECNFTSFIGPWGVQQPNCDVTSNCLIIIGF